MIVSKNNFQKIVFLSLFSIIFFSGLIFSTTVMMNSQNYEDIVAGAAYSSHNGYRYLFAMNPQQAIFLVNYYTTNRNEPIIYIEGTAPILPNMQKLLEEKELVDLKAVSPDSVQFWFADNLNKEQAIIVGAKYGQDALSVSSYAALTGSPIFFVDDPTDSSILLKKISSLGYKEVIVYGPVAHQISKDQLDILSSKKIIDTGSRYNNNLEIVKMFLEKKPTQQFIFISGKTFEKSMADKNFPNILVGRSDVPKSLIEFLQNNKAQAGIVYNGDADIIDGSKKISGSIEGIKMYVKFAEGYSGSSTPLPLMIIPLPAPLISLDILNTTYNINSKLVELRILNKGDFVSLIATASIEGAGSGSSSELLLQPGAETTLSIALDASKVIIDKVIKKIEVTVQYGEDTALMDNVDSISFLNVLTSDYVDKSSVKLNTIAYSDEKKAFVLNFDGVGWVEGTLKFKINELDYTKKIPLTEINGKTTVDIKHLLNADEIAFLQGENINFFFRFGEKEGILIKEKSGKEKLQILKQTKSTDTGISQKQTTEGGLGILPIIAIIALVLIGAFIFMKMRSEGDSF